MAENTTGRSSLRDIYYVLFRHKYREILFFLVAVTTFALFALLAPKVYRSTTKLLMRLGHETVSLDPTATTGQIVNFSQSRQNELNSELEILRSRDLAEDLVDSLGPEAFLRRENSASGEGESGEDHEAVAKTTSLTEYLGLVEPLSDREKAVLKFLGGVEIEVLEETNIIRIAYESSRPAFAQQVVARLVDLFLEKHIRVHQTPESYRFFTEQSDQLRQGLVRSMEELRTLKNQTGISSLEEQRTDLLERIANLERENERARAALASSHAKVSVLQETLERLPETIVTAESSGFPNVPADALRQTLHELKLMEFDLVEKFDWEHRLVKSIRGKIAAVEEALSGEDPVRTQVTRGVNTTRAELQVALLAEEANLYSAEAQVEVLQEQLTAARDGLKALNDSEFTVRNLERELTIQEESYRRYAESREQARIDHALEAEKISSISVVQKATLPIRPVRPKRLLILLAGLLVGVTGAIGLAFACEFLTHSIRTPADAQEKLDLPTLASIPRLHPGDVRPTGLSRGTAPARRQNGTEEESPVTRDASTFEDSLGRLRERLLRASNGSSPPSPQVVAITACYAGRGATSVAANLAVTLARTGAGKVLLVDADLEKPSLHGMLQAKLEPGLSNILSTGRSHDRVVQATPWSHLWVLSAGNVKQEIPKAFHSERWKNLLKSLKEEYRFVVVDAPPVIESSSALPLASLADGVLLVLESERSRWEVARRAREELVSAKVNILGVVLNKRRFPIPEWLYRTL